jgi:thiol-disulfide isomerase/thioredoxin
MSKRAILGILLAAAATLGQAASLELTDTAGVTHTLASHHGKWVLVNAWATWCGPCVAEMPELDALAKAHPDLVVLGLAVDGKDPRRALQFAERLHVSYPIVPGTDAALRQFKLRAYPTSFLYDPAGNQALLKEGRITRAEIEAAMQEHRSQ